MQRQHLKDRDRQADTNTLKMRDRRGAGDCLEGTARGLETFSYREIRMLERRLTEGRTEVGWHGVVAGEQMRTKYNDPYVTKCHNETHSSK